jgi:hypothetical protein
MLRKTAIVTALVAAGLAAIGSTPAGAASHPVRFLSIQSDPPGTDDGSNASLNQEFVVLKNFSSHSVKMGAYAVEIGNKEFDFPSGFTLQSGSKVWVHTGKGTDSRHDVYWGRTAYAYPNNPTFAVELWGPGGIQNGVTVSELEDTCMVLTSANQPC